MTTQQPTDEGLKAMKEGVENLKLKAQGKEEIRVNPQDEMQEQDQPLQSQKCQLCESMRKEGQSQETLSTGQSQETPMSTQAMEAQSTEEDQPLSSRAQEPCSHMQDQPKEQSKSAQPTEQLTTSEGRCTECHSLFTDQQCTCQGECVCGKRSRDEEIKRLDEEGRRLEEEGAKMRQRCEEMKGNSQGELDPRQQTQPQTQGGQEHTHGEQGLVGVFGSQPKDLSGKVETRNVEGTNTIPVTKSKTGPRIICIPCDLGEHSMKTVDWANAKVVTSDDHVILVSVRDHQKQTVDQKVSKDVIDVSEVHQQKEDEKVEEVLKQFKELMPNRDVELKVLRGDRRHELVKYINDLDPNFVVVGAREMSGIKKAFTNSTSEYLAQRVNVPVMIYRPFAKSK